MECSIGEFKREGCHKTTYSRSSWLKGPSEISETDKILLVKRTGIASVNNVCEYHYKKYVVKFYALFGLKCCDPLKLHKKNVTKSLREISLPFHQEYQQINLIPGLAICSRCHAYIKKNYPTQNFNLVSAQESEDMLQPEVETDDSKIQLVNDICSILCESPVLSIKKIPISRRKRKIEEKVVEIGNSVRRKLFHAFSIKDTEESEVNVPVSVDVNADSENLHSDYVELIEELKSKFSISTTFEEKYQILSLLPKSWSITKIKSEFGCSHHIAKNAKDMRNTNGALSKYETKKIGRTFTKETLDAVKDFYENDDISRMMPGQKDCLTVRDKQGNKSRQQKRLVLFNLREIYIKFKEIHSDIKIGFSSFCSLRPKNCIIAGATGTHSVCVCVIHQNMKLMLSAIKTKLTYQDLLKGIVCDSLNENCMLLKCNECPGVDTIDSKIDEELESMSTITYSQWASTDRCRLLAVVKTNEEFKEDFKEQLLKMKLHHFITKKQSEYLKNLKERLHNDEECIILADFSENYTFLVQDEAQSFHWTNDQATLHPFVVYFKKDNIIQCRTFCVISDYLTHSTVSFFAFQRVVIEFLKQEYVKIKKIYYFSDGAASQYKNKKNFVNLCYHSDDFGLQAEWNFFATSHGKTPCDGAGGTIKRIVRKASLQNTTGNHILTPQAMFGFCEKQVPGIKFFFVTKSDVDDAELYLSTRFKDLITIKNTRSYHWFAPISTNKLNVRRYSSSENFEVVKVKK